MNIIILKKIGRKKDAKHGLHFLQRDRHSSVYHMIQLEKWSSVTHYSGHLAFRYSRQCFCKWRNDQDRKIELELFDYIWDLVVL